MNANKIAILSNEKSGKGGFDKVDIERVLEHKTQLTFLDIRDDVSKWVSTCKRKKISLIIAVGGDGTVNAAANVAVACDITLGVIPAGTFNHFAKDLSIPQELDEAAQIILSGYQRQIDYAQVNDHVFINNSSIGAYPKAVRKKSSLRDTVGKGLASVLATVYAAKKLRNIHATLAFDNKKITLRSPSIFVGNNPYGFHDGTFTSREKLDSGRLFVHVITTNRWGRLLVLGIKIMTGKKRTEDDIRFTTRELEISTKETMLSVALDGEVVLMETPLHYVMQPLGLRVMSPQP